MNCDVVMVLELINKARLEFIWNIPNRSIYALDSSGDVIHVIDVGDNLDTPPN